VTAQPVVAVPPGRNLSDLLADTRFRMTVLGTSRDPNAKVTVLLYPVGADRSPLVVKVPTTDVAAQAVAREAGILAALHSFSSPLIASTVPRVVEMVTTSHGEALVATMAGGTPMTTAYHRWRHTRSRVAVSRDLGAVAAWLRQLHTETASGSAPVEMDAGITDRILTRFVDEPNAAHSVSAVASACSRLRQYRAPRTVVHGDLWCGNLLVGEGSVTGVVDWEEGTAAGEPLRDVARFALTYALYLDRHTRPGGPVSGHPGLRASGWGAGIAFLLDGDGWACDLLRTLVRLSMRRLGVPGDLWRDALVAGIAEIAALADDPTFARAHLNLLGRVVESPRTVAAAQDRR
jgi:aminoglycoside phosphotransferase (APT) family kinase protein